MHSGIKVTAVAVLATGITAVYGQRTTTPSPAPSAPSTGNTGTSPGGISNPSTTTSPSPFPTSPGRNTPTTPGQQQPQMGGMNGPIYVSGKVVLDDGTPPPDTVTVERVCNGVARPEGYTDSKGRFSFQLGQNTATMSDASVGGGGPGRMAGGMGAPGGGMYGSGMGGRGISSAALMTCEIRASLPGYRSEVVSLAGRRSLDNPDVGTIILHRLGNVEGSTISMTSLQAPKDAKKAYEKGFAAARKKKYEDAEKDFQKAVDAYPKYATGWFELGLCQELQGNVDAARKSYAQSLAADPKFIKPYLQLAGISAREKNWKDVASTTDRAIKLDPYDFPQAYFFNSVAQYSLGNLEAAEKSAREAEKLDTQHQYPRVNQLLGFILADRQDFSGAAAQLRSYLKYAPDAQDAEKAKAQLSELEKRAAAK
jgi:Flp pilus assembly protein TadD